MSIMSTPYREIASYKSNMCLTKSALKELRTHLSFAQLRFHCNKQKRRRFHVITAANSTGEAVVQYFSGQTDVQPDACGSFVRMEDDNSSLARNCSKWGNDGHKKEVGKWSWFDHDQNRLSNHPAFVSGAYHWVLLDDPLRLECDDFNNQVSNGDFWKVFVR